MHNHSEMLPTNKTAFEALIKELRKVLADATPEEVIQAALVSWMTLMCPLLPMPPACGSLMATKEVRKFAEWLKQCEVVTGAFWLSSAYTRLINPAFRKTNAMYFTPPSLTARLLDNVERHGDSLTSGQIIDPACGGAAFLAPAAQRISKQLLARGLSPDQVLQYIEANLFGCDTSKFLCFLSESFLRMVLADVITQAGRNPRFNIVQGDGLSSFAEHKGKFSLVLCNPPYRKMTQVELAPYLECYKDVIKGQPNLYSLFIHRATQLLAPNGIAGLLTPMSFLSGRTFIGVRADLIAKGAVRQLDLIHEKNGVFLSAEQDTVITIWAKVTDCHRPSDVFCLAGDSTEPAGALSLSSAPGPWPVPRASADAELLALFNSPPSSLKDYGYASRTGAIVVHRDSRARFQEEADGVDAKVLVPLIWPTNIDPRGGLHLDRMARNCSGKFIDMCSLKSPCLVKNPAVAFQRVSTDDQPRRLVCAVVPERLVEQYGGVVGENHVGFLEQTNFKSPVSPELLVKVLSTETIDRLFRCISGATNVSAYELAYLPLPNIKKVIFALNNGFSVDDAVRLGLGLTVS